MPGAPGLSQGKERKDFFFEKKKQKTFGLLVTVLIQRYVTNK
jgi:hypothetical protein